ACERQQTQRQSNGACSVFEPRSAFGWIAGDGKPDENIAAREQHREEYPRERGSARRLEFVLIRQVELTDTVSVPLSILVVTFICYRLLSQRFSQFRLPPSGSGMPLS